VSHCISIQIYPGLSGVPLKSSVPQLSFEFHSPVPDCISAHPTRHIVTHTHPCLFLLTTDPIVPLSPTQPHRQLRYPIRLQMHPSGHPPYAVDRYHRSTTSDLQDLQHTLVIPTTVADCLHIRINTLDANYSRSSPHGAQYPDPHEVFIYIQPKQYYYQSHINTLHTSVLHSGAIHLLPLLQCPNQSPSKLLPPSRYRSVACRCRRECQQRPQPP